MNRRLLAFAVALAATAVVAALAPSVEAPDAAVDVRARAEGAAWTFEYPNRRIERYTLRIPDDGRSVRVAVTADGATQWCFIPGLAKILRVTPDAVTTFQTRREATVYCTGSRASVAEIRRVPADVFDAPVFACFAHEPVTGERLVRAHACTMCHSLDGSPSVAPSFKGMIGRDEELTTGAHVVVDEKYVYESIRSPRAKIARGYERVEMPTFSLSDAQIEAMQRYFATLR